MRNEQERMTNSPSQQLTAITRACYDVCNIIDVSVVGDNQQEIQKRVALGRRYALRLRAINKQTVSLNDGCQGEMGGLAYVSHITTGAI
jgi:hypothetical protein